MCCQRSAARREPCDHSRSTVWWHLFVFSFIIFLFSFLFPSVVVSILSNNPDTGESSMRTVAVLRRGSSFGEIAILHHGRRTATVSSQGPVHLLAITREDFFDIFMRGQAPGQEPEHVKFLRWEGGGGGRERERMGYRSFFRTENIKEFII